MSSWWRRDADPASLVAGAGRRGCAACVAPSFHAEPPRSRDAVVRRVLLVGGVVSVRDGARSFAGVASHVRGGSRSSRSDVHPLRGERSGPDPALRHVHHLDANPLFHKQIRTRPAAPAAIAAQPDRQRTNRASAPPRLCVKRRAPQPATCNLQATPLPASAGCASPTAP